MFNGPTSYFFSLAKMSFDGGIRDLEAKRLQHAGPGGMKGLLKNPRLFCIAMVGALGGLNYGYEQGACEYQKTRVTRRKASRSNKAAKGAVELTLQTGSA